MKFELLTMTKGKCTNVNFKPQKHGDQDVMAVYLNVNFDLPNGVLDMFDPRLRTKIYFSRDDDAGQLVVTGVDQILPNLNFPFMEPFGWATEMTGCSIDVDYGLGQEGDSNLWLEGCKVCKFKVTPKEGGTVNVALQIQNATDQLTTDMCGKLSGLFLVPFIELRIIPPAVEALAAPDEDDIDPDAPDGMENPFGDNLLPPDEPLTASDIFANANEPAPSTTVVKVKKSRKLGSDAEQAAHQAAVLAADDVAMVH